MAASAAAGRGTVEFPKDSKQDFRNVLEMLILFVTGLKCDLCLARVSAM